MRRWLARILQLVFLLLLAGVVWISGRGWVQTGERVLRLSLSRALKGDVRWTGVHIHFPDRLEIEHFEVDSVLRVDSLWLSVSIRNLLPLTFPRASIARIYVNIDAWLPRFWVSSPDTSAPPRAPLFPPLHFRQVQIREVTVRAVEGLYRARDIHLQYSMRASSMRAHLRIGMLYTPFERIYRDIVGSYLLTYPHHRPQQLVRVDSARGTDRVRFLNLRTYRDTLRLTGLQLVLQEGLELQNFSVTLRLPAYRGPATVERVVLQHSGDTLQNLQGILALPPGSRRAIWTDTRLRMSGKGLFSRIEGWMDLFPPYRFFVRIQADSLWVPQAEKGWLAGQILARGTPDTVHFQALFQAGTLYRIPVDALHVEGQWIAATGRVDSLQLNLNMPGATGSFRGHLTSGNRPTGEFNAVVENLDRFLESRMPHPPTGGLVLYGSLHEGILKDFVMVGRQLARDSLRLQSLSGRVERKRGLWESRWVAYQLTRAHEPLADSLVLEWVVDTTGTGEIWLNGRLPGGGLDLSGAFSRDSLQWTFRSRRFVLNLPHYTSGDQGTLDLVLRGHTLQFWIEGLRGLDNLGGEVQLDRGFFWVDAGMEQVPLRLLKGWVATPPQGTLSGWFHGTGTLDHPTFRWDLSLNDFQYATFSWDSVRMVGQYAHAQVHIQRLRIVQDSGALELRGTLPFPSDTLPLHLDVRLEGLGKGLANYLLQDLIYVDQGGFWGHLVVEGTPRDPDLRGQITFYGTGGVFLSTRTLLDSIWVDMEGRGDTILIPLMMATSGEGSIEGQGDVQIYRYLPRETRMELYLKEVEAIPNPLMDAIVSGNLTLSGMYPEYLLEGTLVIHRAYIDARFGKLSALPRQQATASSPLRMNITVTADNRIYLENELADLEMNANLTYIKPDAIHTYTTGDMEVLRGTFLYLDHLFNIEEGRITFENDPDFNPKLFLIGRTRVDTFDVMLRVEGTLQEPQFGLQSDPGLDTLNILYLLTFGQPLSSGLATVGEFSFLQTRLFSLAGALLSARFRRQIGLQELRVESGGWISLGLFITPEIYFQYAGDPRDLSASTYILRYYFRRRRRSALYFSREADGNVSWGLEYEWEFR